MRQHHPNCAIVRLGNCRAWCDCEGEGMEHFGKIRGWATDRNLILGSTPQAQFVKLIEEVGELAEAIAKDKEEQFIDSIGDVIVVLTILAEQKGFLIERCIEQAWHEIKDRKGRMVDGIFVRDVD